MYRDNDDNIRFAASTAVYRNVTSHRGNLCVAASDRRISSAAFFSSLALYTACMIPTLWPGHVTGAWVSSKRGTQPPPSRERVDLAMMRKTSPALSRKRWLCILSRCYEDKDKRRECREFSVWICIFPRNHPWFLRDWKFLRKFLRENLEIERNVSEHICRISFYDCSRCVKFAKCAL